MHYICTAAIIVAVAFGFASQLGRLGDGGEGGGEGSEGGDLSGERHQIANKKETVRDI